MKLNGLLKYKIDSVFLSEEDKNDQNYVIFKDYMPFLLDKVTEKILAID